MTDFEKWCEAVDSLLKRSYFITLEDVGWLAPDLLSHFAREPDPAVFCGWLANKYDLDDGQFIPAIASPAI